MALKLPYEVFFDLFLEWTYGTLRAERGLQLLLMSSTLMAAAAEGIPEAGGKASLGAVCGGIDHHVGGGETGEFLAFEELLQTPRTRPFRHLPFKVPCLGSRPGLGRGS